MSVWLLALILTILVLLMALVVVIVLLVRKENPVKIYNAGMRAYKKGNYKRSCGLFLDALNLSQEYLDAKFMLGSSYFMLKKYSKAQACFIEIVENGQKDFDTLYNLALTFQMQKKFNDASKLFSDALKQNPRSAESHYNLGLMSFEQKKYKNALDSFRTAEKIKQNDTNTLFYINQSKDELYGFENEIQYNEIIKTYQTLSGLKGSPDSINLAYARACAKSGDSQKAFELCKKALNSDSKNPELHKLLGLLHLVANRPQEAREELQKSLKLNDKDAEVYNLLAYAFLNLENTSEFEKNKKIYENCLRTTSHSSIQE